MTKKKTIMVQGTCSNAGKSLITAGLCRILAEDGYKVAPFKAQNMALNSFITEDGLEMGRAQVVQAEASKVKPDVRMNPILLKPNSDKGSQLILHGHVQGNFSAREYYKQKPQLQLEVKKAFDSLQEEYDIIVMEGAGSPAEINLKDEDLVNMGMAKLVNSPVILVGDIDRGGVFASLVGTIALFDDEEKSLVKGFVINKFRGDKTILDPGIDMLEDITKLPVLGVVPYLDVDIDDEDSLDVRAGKMALGQLVDIAVIRSPRISNFTDFAALEAIEGVNVRYVRTVKELGMPDMIILPGSKNTMGDLKWLRETGLEAKVLQHAKAGKPVFGICGGFQMLGKCLEDPLGVEHGGTMKGLGLLPHTTVFKDQKVQKTEEGTLNEVEGIFSELSGKEFKGYHIHMGVSNTEKSILNAGNIYGTYIHGIFDKEEISKVVVGALMNQKGISSDELKTFDLESYKEEQYGKLAAALREVLDMNKIYGILGLEKAVEA